MKQQTMTDNFAPFLALFEEIILASKIDAGETFITKVDLETTDDD